jgi:hypothetical protein
MKAYQHSTLAKLSQGRSFNYDPVKVLLGGAKKKVS